MEDRPKPRLLGAPSNGGFERDIDDRRRLQLQFGLLREDFNLWFDEALHLAALPTDSDRATFSALDAGCGEGAFTREIADRYPAASVVGIDVDAAAIDVAKAPDRARATVQYLVHDVGQPAPAGVVPGAGFDMAVMWLVLPYLTDRRAALANLAAALRPGGAALLCNVPDESVRLSHPAAAGLLAAGQALVERLGLGGLETTLQPLLQEAGFDEITTEELIYPLGGATALGQRWHSYLLASMSLAKRPVVDVFGLIDTAEYDDRFNRLAAESVLRLRGEVRFLVTVARRT
jgi:SAM-dependent methyltransferase